MKCTVRWLLVLTWLSVGLPAFAYIDPNAGGFLFQLLAPLFAAVVGVWVFLRRWITGAGKALWQKIIGTITRR
jgi:hypothetical protein